MENQKLQDLEKIFKAGGDAVCLPNTKPQTLTEFLDKNEDLALRLDAVISRFNSDIFINNVCLSYDHSFGLMTEEEQKKIRFECKEWMRAISNNWEYFKNGL